MTPEAFAVIWPRFTSSFNFSTRGTGGRKSTPLICPLFMIHHSGALAKVAGTTGVIKGCRCGDFLKRIVWRSQMHLVAWHCVSHDLRAPRGSYTITAATTTSSLQSFSLPSLIHAITDQGDTPTRTHMFGSSCSNMRWNGTRAGA